MIVRLDRKELREEKLGNKGKFLLQMKRQGFEVPGGFILDSDVYDETIAGCGEEAVRELLVNLKEENV